MLDSEGFWLRNTTIRELTWSVVEQKTYLVNGDRNWELEPHYTSPMYELLDPPRRQYSWGMESYLWVYEKSILSDVVKVLDARKMVPWTMASGKYLMIEVVISAFIQHNNPKYLYFWTNAKKLFRTTAEYIYYTKGLEDNPHQFFGCFEWARLRLQRKDPKANEIIQDAWKRSDLKLFRAYDNADSIDFILAAPNIKILVSEWVPNVIKAFSGTTDEALLKSRTEALAIEKAEKAKKDEAEKKRKVKKDEAEKQPMAKIRLKQTKLFQ